MRRGIVVELTAADRNSPQKHVWRARIVLATAGELRLAIGRNLLNLVADGVTDPIPLRWLTIESLLFPRRYKATTRIQGALNCKKNIMTGSHSLPSTTTGLSGDSLSMPSRFSEATTGRAMPRGSGKRKEA
jgi:hypothetical protein